MCHRHAIPEPTEQLWPINSTPKPVDGDPSRTWHRDVLDALEFDNAVGTKSCVIHHPTGHGEWSTGGKDRATPNQFVGTGNQKQLRPIPDEVATNLIVVALSGPLELSERVRQNESQPSPKRWTDRVANRSDGQSSSRSGRPNKNWTARRSSGASLSTSAERSDRPDSDP